MAGIRKLMVLTPEMPPSYPITKQWEECPWADQTQSSLQCCLKSTFPQAMQEFGSFEHELPLLLAWSHFEHLAIKTLRTATSSVHAQSRDQCPNNHVISACTVPWSVPVSHWSLPDKHVISAWWAMWSVTDQPRHQCMRSHVISAW